MRRPFFFVVTIGLAVGWLTGDAFAASRIEHGAIPAPAGNTLPRALSDEAVPDVDTGAADAGELPSVEQLPPIENQLWLVSTRTLPHVPVASSRRAVPEVSRYRHEAWERSSLDELMAARNPGLTTAVLVHGNDTDDQDARAKGMGVFHSLGQRADRPFRLIVWSWPSDYVGGTLRQDVRVKAERADVDAFYLAQFIDELNSTDPVSLVAYSLGARVTTGALHLLGGGALAARTLTVQTIEQRPPLRAVLMAPAVDHDSLLPGRRHGRALNAVDRMVLLVNPRDRVLRWYRFISPRSGATALGSHGVTSLAALGPLREKIEQIDVHPLLGGQHGWSSYASSPDILEQLRREIMIGTGPRTARGE